VAEGGAPRVFLVTLEAVEAVGAPPLTVLAFARADDEDAGKAVAIAELEGCGWTSIHVVRTGELLDRRALPEDFRSAVANAERYGCGLIVYDEP
jgi:hypothetical protein